MFGVLTYSTPELSYRAKILVRGDDLYRVQHPLHWHQYACDFDSVTTLTTDPQERITLTSWRMFGSKLGALAINASALNMFRSWERERPPGIYLKTLPIYAVGFVALFFVGYWNLKEVVSSKKNRADSRQFRALKGNWPWLIIFTSSFLFWIAFISAFPTVPYFLQYNLHRADLTSLAYSLGFHFARDRVFAAVVLQMVFQNRRVGLGTCGNDCWPTCFFISASRGNSVRLILAGWISAFSASGMAMAVPFSILSDSVDYRRMENRDSRCWIARRRWRGVLFESRRRPRRRHSPVDHGQRVAMCRTRNRPPSRSKASNSVSSGCRRFSCR